jgi:rhodanese-related sulfurtransferase
MSGNLLVKQEELAHKKGIVTIWSAPRRVNMPPSDIAIDVGSLMHFDWGYVYMGQEPIIQNTLYNVYEDFFTSLTELISNLPLESGLTVLLICESGERISVAAAELLARELKSAGKKVEVYHKGLAKWFKF